VHPIVLTPISKVYQAVVPELMLDSFESTPPRTPFSPSHRFSAALLGQ
jgi:hypothetical protein